MAAPRLADLTSPDAGGFSMLFVPLGSTEQHGPHLPLDVDAVIATEVAARVAAAIPGAVVAPTIAIGASGEHDGFAGTLSVGTEVLHQLLVELVRSARGFRRVVVVDAHGGNHAATTGAIDQLNIEGHSVLGVRCAFADPDADAHAGRTETSVMLALAPERVRMELASPGATAPWAELRDDVLADGVGAVSANGVLGDPRGATAEEGRALLDELVARLTGIVEHWANAQPD